MVAGDGGPAYPSAFWHEYGNGQIRSQEWSGMTLRDRFAIAALQGMLAYSVVNPMVGNYHENCSKEIAASAAYEYADAMITARAAE